MFESLRYRPGTPAEHPDTKVKRKKASQEKPARARVGVPRAMVASAVVGRLVEVDAFEHVLLLAGLDNHDDLPPREAPFTPEDAAAQYDLLSDKPVTLARFAPRLVTSFLLREVMEGEGDLPRAALLQRMERFRGLAVLRPDGCLAWSLTGETQQRVAPVEWKKGAFRAHGFEVGHFYSGRNGMAFFPVDEQLRERREAGVLAEVYDDADVISRVLDGAEESFVELGMAIGKLVVHPIDSAAGLAQLPEVLGALLAHSPEYLERFTLMTRGEQIKALSKLATTLLSTSGAAGGTTRTMATAGRGLEAVSAPALSLTAEGARDGASGAGRCGTERRAGGGHHPPARQRGGEARAAGASGGPRAVGAAHESMSKRSARYQEQITGRSAREAYWVGGVGRKNGGVKLDGFEKGVLLDAKGPGYANKFDDNLNPKPWFALSGAEQLMEQALRQLRVAGNTPIRWHVAEKKSADAIRKLLEGRRIRGIEVVHTPAMH